MNTNQSRFYLKGKSVWVAGHRGMVGAALVRRLEAEECEVLTAGRETLDLGRQDEVEDWMHEAKPDVVVVAAAKVGGIQADNDFPAQFIYENLTISTNIIHAAHLADVSKLLFLGSSCIYPKLAPQPMTEESLLTGPLEPTNEWYAVAKIAGIKLCQAYRRQFGRDFISALPTNLYGPGDDYDLASSHVMPALMAKAHTAKLEKADFMQVWGTGYPRREFLHVDDLADGLVFILRHYSGDAPLNIGTGEDLTIGELAALLGEVVGFKGELRFQSDKPDGTPRKLLDVSRLQALGWSAKIKLPEGLTSTYRWYLENVAENDDYRKSKRGRSR